MAVSCSDAVNNTRLPNYPVYLNLSGAGMWNTYGIGGVGMHREFIKDRQLPAGFPYLASSYTGYGGILLVGVDAAANFADETWPYLPMAFDMSCPVEAKPMYWCMLTTISLRPYAPFAAAVIHCCREAARCQGRP